MVVVAAAFLFLFFFSAAFLFSRPPFFLLFFVVVVVFSLLLYAYRFTIKSFQTQAKAAKWQQFSVLFLPFFLSFLEEVKGGRASSTQGTCR